jgi:proliferating cell nuclear antigen PCNA
MSSKINNRKTIKKLSEDEETEEDIIEEPKKTKKTKDTSDEPKKSKKDLSDEPKKSKKDLSDEPKKSKKDASDEPKKSKKSEEPKKSKKTNEDKPLKKNKKGVIEQKKSPPLKPNKNRILEIKINDTFRFKHSFILLENSITECNINFIPADAVELNDEDDDIDDDFIEEVNDSTVHTKDANKKRNNGGITIIKSSEDNTTLIKLIMDATNFEYFRCEPRKGDKMITIGIDLNIFNSYLKNIDDDKPLVMYMNADNRNSLYIHNYNDDSDSSQSNEVDIDLIDIPNGDPNIEHQQEFPNMIFMKSKVFHTLCKNLSLKSNIVEIISVDNEIHFKGKSEGGKVTRTFKDKNKSDLKVHSSKMVQAIYDLKSIMHFSKCEKICEDIILYLKDDFPLLMEIRIGDIGKFFVFLAPSDEED